MNEVFAPNLFLPGPKKETIDFAVKDWLDLAKNAISKKGSFTVALSGGSTPKAIYQELAKKKQELDWSKVDLYFSDERVVPLDSDESNFKTAWESGFKDLVDRKQIHPMFTGGTPEEAAAKYETPPIDLVMLGIGTDGHTASLFPFTHALTIENNVAAANYLPNPQVWRITLTYHTINSADAIRLYIIGKDKAEIMHKVLNSPVDYVTYPVQKIDNKALWILDSDAASLLE